MSDGIETAVLEQSHAYFDVDGDMFSASGPAGSGAMANDNSLNSAEGRIAA